MILRLICGAVYFFPLPNSNPLYGYTTIRIFVYQLITFGLCLAFLLLLLSSGTAGSGAKYVFDFLSNHNNVLPSDFASLHFYQPCVNPLVPSRFSRRLVL